MGDPDCSATTSPASGVEGEAGGEDEEAPVEAWAIFSALAAARISATDIFLRSAIVQATPLRRSRKCAHATHVRETSPFRADSAELPPPLMTIRPLEKLIFPGRDWGS